MEPARDLWSPDAAGHAEAHFRADPVRVVRAAREAAERGQAPAQGVAEAARAALPALAASDPARVRDEIGALLMADRPDVGLQWMHASGQLAVVLPELEATVEFAQEAGRRHKDVWEHTKQVVCQAARRPAVRWAALLHDIGKVPTRRFLPGGGVHFHRHAVVGARMFDEIARRLAFDKATRRALRFLIQHHLRANQYDGAWTDSAVRRFDRELREHLDDLLELSWADITSKRAERVREARQNIADLRERIARIRELDARLPPLPKGLGTAIAQAHGRPPGPWIGRAMAAIEAAIDAGELEERREFDHYLAWLRERGLPE